MKYLIAFSIVGGFAGCSSPTGGGGPAGVSSSVSGIWYERDTTRSEFTRFVITVSPLVRNHGNIYDSGSAIVRCMDKDKKNYFLPDSGQRFWAGFEKGVLSIQHEPPVDNDTLDLYFSLLYNGDSLNGLTSINLGNNQKELSHQAIFTR